MPRLAKGAKETFGWVQISRQRKILVPPDAWERYGFQVGEQAIFLRASKTSAGFSLTNRKLFENCFLSLHPERILAVDGFYENRTVHIPNSIPVAAGDKMLTVFGSRYALGFISKGPIYERAQAFPELEIYTMEVS